MQICGESTAVKLAAPQRTAGPISTLPPRSSFPRISFTRSFSFYRQPHRDFRNLPGFSRDLFADKPMSTRLRRLFRSCPALPLLLPKRRHDLHISDCT